MRPVPLREPLACYACCQGETRHGVRAHVILPSPGSPHTPCVLLDNKLFAFVFCAPQPRRRRTGRMTGQRPQLGWALRRCSPTSPSPSTWTEWISRQLQRRRLLVAEGEETGTGWGWSAALAWGMRLWASCRHARRSVDGIRSMLATVLWAAGRQHQLRNHVLGQRLLGGRGLVKDAPACGVTDGGCMPCWPPLSAAWQLPAWQNTSERSVKGSGTEPVPLLYKCT